MSDRFARSSPRHRSLLLFLAVGFPAAGSLPACGDASTKAPQGSSSGLDDDADDGYADAGSSSGEADDTAADRDSSGSESGAATDAYCGNGIVEVHESCDDANDLDSDGCNADCRVSGSVVWARAHDGEAHADDRARSIAFLPDGATVTGGVATTTQGERSWIRRHDDEGTVVWIEYPAAVDDVVAVAVDRDGFVVACGSLASDAGRRAWVARYAADGGVDWELEWSDGEVCSAIAAADDGRLVATGSVTITADENPQLWLAKLNSHGDELWSTHAGPSSAPDARGHAVAIDAESRILVAGRISRDTADDSNVFFGRWSASGVGPQWSIESGDDAGIDEARGLAIEGPAAVLVGTLDAATARPRGFHMRVDDRPGSGTVTPHADPAVTSINSVAIDHAGNVVMVGAVLADDGARDIWVEKRDATWAVLWTTTVAGADGADDDATDVAIGDDGTVMVFGAISTQTRGSDAWVGALAL